jgi:hypothetical protein
MTNRYAKIALENENIIHFDENNQTKKGDKKHDKTYF